MPTIAQCFLTVMLALFAWPAAAQDDDSNPAIDDIPHITLAGAAQTEAPPDIATISVAVVTEAPMADAAATQTSRKVADIIAAAQGAGIAAADIATPSVTLVQTFDEIRNSNGMFVGQKPRGFSAETTIDVTVRDLGKVGALAQTLISKGANRLNGISFAVEHPEALLARLTAAAVQNATVEAQAATKAAGVHLGRVLLIERPSQSNPHPLVMAAAAPRASAIAVASGTLSFSREVEVTWALDAN